MISLAAYDRIEKAEARAVTMQAERDGLECGVIHDAWKEPFAFRVVCWPTGAPANVPMGCALVYTVGPVMGAAQLTLDLDQAA